MKKYEDCYVNIEDDTAEIGFNDDEESLKTIKNIIFMEFAVDPGDKVKEGSPLLNIEAMKGTMQLKSRVEGIIVKLNTDVQEDPELLQNDPTQWLLKIRVEK
ncbi:MAG: Glycine cleavage system H protein [Candidatus Woesearchaeota archaeon]|nr:Glycine cleavage system H protein [Candidatus Woesearchaeota archaeon]